MTPPPIPHVQSRTMRSRPPTRHIGWGARIIVLSLIAFCCACSRRDDQRELLVFAAASLTDAFDAIARAYEADTPGVHVVVHLAGSQILATQIIEGAKADAYASADRRHMTRLQDLGLVGSPRVFAANRLVIVTPQANPAGINTPADLARPGAAIVLASENVPVGLYTVHCLDALGLTQAVAANVVSLEDNARAVLAKVVLGEADAGIVYATDAMSAADRVRTVAFPPEVGVRASYLIATLHGAEHGSDADRFVSFVTGPRGVEILEQFGFDAP